MSDEPPSGYHPKGEEPNISLPRDPALAEFALEFFHMNQLGWPRRTQQHIVWPTEKSYRWMNEHD